jgi:hypothetical protein
LRDERGFREGGQIDEPYAIWIIVSELQRSLLSKARLAAASGSSQREQASRQEQLLDLGNFLLASDETG